jgi:hypothetical protein
MLEDRVVPTGPGTWSAFSPSPFSPRFGAPAVSIPPIAVNGVYITRESAYIFGGTDGSTTLDDTQGISEVFALGTGFTPPPAHRPVTTTPPWPLTTRCISSAA